MGCLVPERIPYVPLCGQSPGIVVGLGWGISKAKISRESVEMKSKGSRGVMFEISVSMSY